MAEEETAQTGTNTVTIDGQEYKLSDLSDAAKQQIANVRATDQELAHLNQQTAIARTARGTYLQQLRTELDKGK